MYVFLRAFVYLRACMSMYLRVSTCLRMYVLACVSTCLCVYVPFLSTVLRAPMYLRVYVSTCLCVCFCVYVRSCVSTFLRVYLHTRVYLRDVAWRACAFVYLYLFLCMCSCMYMCVSFNVYRRVCMLASTSLSAYVCAIKKTHRQIGLELCHPFYFYCVFFQPTKLLINYIKSRE